ncbi:hypothetical protein FB45DRAFT_488320 [Roridomyces roridus]|uniref:DUF6533 domain-containing protein n=1 Tax=Roridomyces roridus TaxID=1738132 RepID=A0AAD7AZP0_9AGAR|nr:hypothetical protein FB45DRAFT_488320 [Roridomyces roridus]
MDAQSYLLLSQLQVVSYIKAGFLALFAYDTLLQLEQECLYIWQARWTLIKCLYLWTRYSPFVALVISVAHSIHPNLSCESSIFATIYSGFGIGLTELILMVRTYTLYERSKRLLLFFFLLWFSVAGVSFWAVTKWTDKFSSTTAGTSLFASCYFSSSTIIGIGLVCYLSLLVGEIVVISLTLWRFYRQFSKNTSGLFTSLYRDGILYYLAIPPFTIATIIILFTAPPGLSDIADTPVYVMHSVLVCRLINHAREKAAEEDARAATLANLEEVKFRLGSNSVIDIRPDCNV